LDTSKRLLTRDGEKVTLAPKTYDLLLLLVQSEGLALSRRELMSAPWPDTFVEEANLSYQVTALRKALAEEGEKWVETVPKHGYRFTAPVRLPAGHAPARVSRLRHVAPWFIASASIVVALLVLLERKPAVTALVSFYVYPVSKTIQSFALSPDGHHLVMAAGEGTKEPLWVRDSTRRSHGPCRARTAHVIPSGPPMGASSLSSQMAN